MAIFGKKKTTTTLPQTKSALALDQQYNQPAPYAIAVQPNWSYVEQTPNTSQVYGSSPPQGWLVAPIPPYQPVFVQNYIPPPRLPERPRNSERGTEFICKGAALYDLISSKLDAVVTSIDSDEFSGDERDLAVDEPPSMGQDDTEYTNRDILRGKSKGMVNNSISSALISTNYFSKVNLYANSKLPPDLPPMKLYLPTFPLLCLAAQYSERVYTKPRGQEKETHVDADWKMGTKAMVIKSVPMDDMNTIVFAIRGSQTFMDWAVNLNSHPASPEGFLDDPGNFCHAGFLTVARKMIKPVAARLRHLLEEDPSRARYSLLITGHSAGGAVAALLYSHMLSTTREAQSELSILTDCFKRIHCVSFGAPPTSLLPLTKPSNPALRKSLFLSFVNEGDPVPRADKAYVRSLLDLYSSPAPGQSCLESVTPQRLQPLVSGLGGKSSSSLTVNKIRPIPKKSNSAPSTGLAPHWRVPEATLSNAGRLVLLRSVERHETRPNKKKQIHERMNEGVVAQMVSDELLRGVIWGDPVCHMMRLYARRIEILATNAVMGRS